MRYSVAATAIALLPVVQGAPANSTLHRRCGIVDEFWKPQPEDYDQNETGDWLNHWWDSNTAGWKDTGDGFAKAFGYWGLGNTNFNCRDDGSDSNCEVSKACDNRVLNDKGDEARQTYYVMTSISNLHGYFKRISEALTTAGIGAALSKDHWVDVFFYKENDGASLLLKEILVGIGTALGMVLGLAALPEIAPLAAAGASGSALVSGGVGGANAAIQSHDDDPFQQASDLGGILGSIFTDTQKSLTQRNDDLMAGKVVDDHDIRSYLAKGTFLTDTNQWDKNKIYDSLNAQLLGIAINSLWRQQRVFVMGGGACGDGQGIGEGPQDSVVCRDGKAWYLYYWSIYSDRPKTGQGQYGWVTGPPGADRMNKGDYSGVTVEDAISSSLDAWQVAGLNYDEETRKNRADEAVKQGWANPAARGPSWEGIFNLPVCDIGWAVDGKLEGKEWLLQPYSDDSRPLWCGPICEGDRDKTIEFIEAVHMRSVASPKYHCSKEHKDFQPNA